MLGNTDSSPAFYRKLSQKHRRQNSYLHMGQLILLTIVSSTIPCPLLGFRHIGQNNEMRCREDVFFSSDIAGLL